MACPTAQRVGTYGETTGCLCPLRPCRTGSRRGGKKAQAPVATARKALAAQQPKLRKARPSTPAAKQEARTTKRLEAERAALFTHRSLFGQRLLTTTERETLWCVSRRLAQLHALRGMMEQVY